MGAAPPALSSSLSSQLRVEFSRSLADISLLSPEFMGTAVGFLENEDGSLDHLFALEEKVTTKGTGEFGDMRSWV